MHLAIDSSINGYSAALSNSGELVFCICDNASKSQYLLRDLQANFTAKDLDLKDLSQITVNIGPGSFTGIRTALSIVNTLKANLNIPVSPVNNFQILRQQNPKLKEIAFRASSKNPNEFFVSLDENYNNLETNFFTTKLDEGITLLELPEASQSIKILLAYSSSDKQASKEIYPYYLREPSLRKAKKTS